MESQAESGKPDFNGKKKEKKFSTVSPRVFLNAKKIAELDTLSLVVLIFLPSYT